MNTNRFTIGDHYNDNDNDFDTYAIDDNNGIDNKIHLSKIEVYGDKELRDLIVNLLNSYEKYRRNS